MCSVSMWLSPSHSAQCVGCCGTVFARGVQGRRRDRRMCCPLPGICPARPRTVEASTPVPICRTVQEAYEAGRADALTVPTGGPELAAMVADRRVKQSEIDAFVARYQVSRPETHGGVP